MYTIDSLTPINSRYIYGGHYGHRILERDVDKINTLVKLIEERNHENPSPTTGDLVICETATGKVVSERGHIEPSMGGPAICTDPYTPFVSGNEQDGVYMNTSGGYWVPLEPEMQQRMSYEGKQKKMFCTWGHMGPEWDGAVNFYAEVSIWRLRSERFY